MNKAFEIPGYAIKDQINDGKFTLIFHASRLTDHKAVVIKILKAKLPYLEKVKTKEASYESLQALKEYEATKHFQHEYEIIKLLQTSGTVQVYGFEKIGNNLLMILEDGGENLLSYISKNKILSISEGLNISILIAKALQTIHQQNIIHKNINPSNILYDKANNKVRIIDFGIASQLTKEINEFVHVSELEGTLEYLSPEQTGRINRSVDQRSDYYALGVTMYQLFTGTLPFEEKDPIDLINAEISKDPKPPHIINPAVPKVLSDIIMKLLAKNAEDRYQTLFGLIADLKECNFQWQRNGYINDFPLAKKDFSSRFQIPEILYGRTQEVKFLLDAFSRVCLGPSELILIAGNSGIGKTSVVRETHRAISEKKGRFISGKFDLLKKNIPYAPFVQAIEELLEQILEENKESFDLIKADLLKSLGKNAGVLCEVFPSLELIIGPQPSVPSLGPTETQNRFISVFQNFMKVLCTQDHPLVIFLDDLQWTDLSSVRLLRELISKTDIQYLLIIGAYRDNEVTETHPLILMADSFKKEGVLINTLNIAPLKASHIQQLLSDTLTQDLEIVKPLAEICYTRTLGNPFFLVQFLKNLYAEKLINYDAEKESWSWDIDKIRKKFATENVVEYVRNNIEKLSPPAKLLLEYSACLGNIFELQMLSALFRKSPKSTAEVFREVLQENFVIPLDKSHLFISDDIAENATYQFIHDRIQQTAYSLLSTDEKKDLHLQIGELLVKKFPNYETEDKLFSVVNQLNLGSDLILESSKKIALAQSNLKAGLKAMTSAAYSVAFDYFKFGIKLLGNDAWQHAFKLSLQLYSKAAESAYLSDNFEESENLSNTALRNTRDILDQIKIYEIKIYTEIAKNAPINAINIALEVLKKLKVYIPPKPKLYHLVLKLIKTKILLFNKSANELRNLPNMTDPRKIAASNILSATIAPSYYANPVLFPLISLELLYLSVKYGYNRSSPGAFSTYGIILAGILKDIPNAYSFGALALTLVEQHHAIESEVRVMLMVYGLIYHWKDAYRNSLAPLLYAHIRGIETGDQDYSAYAAVFYIECAFYTGINLSHVAEDLRKFYEMNLAQHTHKPVILSLRTFGQVIENLRGLSKDKPTLMEGSYYQEGSSLQEAIDRNNEYALFHFYNNKLILNYLFYDYEAALNASRQALQYFNAVTAAASLRVNNFYDSLTLIALSEQSEAKAKKRLLSAVNKNQKMLKKWAFFAPMNCSAQYYLVKAELARIENKNKEAKVYYQKSRDLAKKHEYIQIQALASELAGKFYLSLHEDSLAKNALIDAYTCYQSWGANAKLNHLKNSFPGLLED